MQVTAAGTCGGCDALGVRPPASAVCALVVLAAALAGCSEDEADGPGAGAGASAAATAASPSGTPIRELLPGGPGDPVRTASGPVEVDVPGWSHADLAFLQMMVPHHRQALEMAALAPDRAASPAVLALADRIEAGQAPEILLMSAWLTDRGVAVPQPGDDPALWDHGAHGHDGMVGMLEPQELAELAGASGEEFDRLFLAGMVRHHEGAVQMARDALAGATDPRIVELAEDVNAGQAAEVVRMQRLLASL